MHSVAIISLSILTSLLHNPTPITADARADPQYRPFLDPFLDINELEDRGLRQLHRRASCDNNYSPCSDYGNSNVCCPPDTTCTTDNANNIACCTVGEACTGTLGYTLPAGGGTSTIYGSTTTTQPSTITSGAGIPSTGVAGGGSTVPNSYFGYVYIPTSYANADLCTSAWSNCQSQSTACFNQLAGTNGVTVGGAGGGTTVVGLTETIAVAASSICSSLSNVACYNLAETQCTIFGNGAGTTTVGMGARPTACVGGVYVAAVGAAGVAAMW